MAYTEAYREHIMYSFNAFCKVVIRYAAINAWRDRNRRRQKEISFEYPTEEKFYPLSTSDEALKSPYEQYPVTICGQTIILTNGELAAAHHSGTPRQEIKKRRVAFLLISKYSTIKLATAIVVATSPLIYGINSSMSPYTSFPMEAYRNCNPIFREMLSILEEKIA